MDARRRSPGAVLGALIASLCWFFLSMSVLAQGAEPPPAEAAGAAPVDDAAAREASAKEHFFRGVEHVQNEDWDAALAEFLESRKLYPTIATTKNAAVTLRQLKRYTEALQMYEELIAEFGRSLRPEEKKTAIDALTVLKKSVGQVMVNSDQSGSTVIIDGQERGTTPLSKPITVDAGTHSIRVFKEGFVPFEQQLLVAGEQRKTIGAKLKALTRSGRLRVAETTGKKLQVVVDGAVVGTTPWEGSLSVGTHTVFLQGEGDLGTPPSAATVIANQTSNLSLRAALLDAVLRVEPTPSNARVDIDGVEVGNGVWEGRLKSGSHTVEVTARGFLAFRRDVTVKRGQREVVTVALQRDVTNPMWRESVFVPHLYVEALGGPGFAPSLGGSADKACDRGECSERSRPFGFLAGARGGYQVTTGLGLELFLGYVQMESSMTRAVEAASDVPITAPDYEDRTRYSGAVAALSASYQFFRDTPLLFRVWAGAARVRATFENGGTFSGTLTRSQVSPPERFEFAEELSIPEKAQNVWLPIVGPEARIGYRLGKTLAIDVGVAVLLMFPPDTVRLDGRTGGDVRRSALRDHEGVFQNADGTAVLARPGLAKLDREEGLGTSFAIMPTVAVRLDL